MQKKLLLLISTLMVSMFVGIAVVLAGTTTISGTLTPGDPTMPVVFISDPNCTGQGVTPVIYHAIPFAVDTSGTYNFTLSSDGGFASLYLHTAAFNPANGFPTCLAGANDNPPVFSYALDANVTYIAVPFDDTFDQLGGGYSLTIEGPGNLLGGSSGVCLHPLPASAVQYQVPLGAPAFYDADLGTQLSFDLPAGSWYIVEFSGDFAQVWIDCAANPIWIPTNTILQ